VRSLLLPLLADALATTGSAPRLVEVEVTALGEFGCRLDCAAGPAAGAGPAAEKEDCTITTSRS
jgi:hypothetical protein